MRMGWMPGWLGWATGGAGNRDGALRAAWKQLVAEVDGQRLAARQLQVVLRHDPAGDGLTRWYCRGPDRRWYLATARCRRHWYRWQVRWQVRPLDEGHLYSALCSDDRALQCIYGHRIGDRLYA